jgi:hypothetical protein
VKKVFSFCILTIGSIALLSSCKKDYQCKCKINTVYDGQVVTATTSSSTIKAQAKEDANRQCVYFEKQVNYLNQLATEQHFCSIDDSN